MLGTKFSIELYANYKSSFDDNNITADSLIPLAGSGQEKGSGYLGGLTAAGIEEWFPDGNGTIDFGPAFGSQFVLTLIIRKL